MWKNEIWLMLFIALVLVQELGAQEAARRPLFTISLFTEPEKLAEAIFRFIENDRTNRIDKNN